jgi:regulator of sigma E protease
MTGIIAVVRVFGGLIFFHELGHFLVARGFGMGVKTFSLGFGPALWARTRGKTRYQVAAVPLGGYVSLVGEQSAAELPPGFSAEESFALRPAWQRFLVIAAGSVFNLLLAWLLCWGMVWVNGRSFVPPIVGEILEATPAADSALRVGDRIVSIDGESIERWAQLSAQIQSSAGKNLKITAQRPDAGFVTFQVTPALLRQTNAKGETLEYWGLGIKPGEAERREFGFLASAREGMTDAGGMVVFIWKVFTDLIAGRVGFDNVGGPVLIAQAIYTQADHGFVGVLMLAALISVNLGVLNLLPVPVLDGGHLAFLLVEMAAGRPVPPRVQERAALVGLFLLLFLMVAATYNDIMRFFS